MTGRRAKVAGIAIAVLYLASAVSSRLLGRLVQGTSTDDLLLFVAFGGFALLGGLLVARKPEHPMGWILGSIGLLLSLGVLGETAASYEILRGQTPGLAVRSLAWLNSWYWYLLLGLVFVYVPLLFPDGRLPSRRWRIPAIVVGVCVGAYAGIGALAERVELQTVDPVTDEPLTIANPIGIRGLAGVEDLDWAQPLLIAFAVGLLLAVAAVVVRFRRSAGTVERNQLKVFLSATCLLPIASLLEIEAIPEIVSNVVFGLVILALPTSIAVAILRHRLYDIDRIISRTASYALLTSVLVGVYALGVVGVGALLPGEQSDLLVAASTLAVAALFRPLRSRIQRVVDRRFNRARYDAARTLESFAVRLRDEVDVDALVDDLGTTVHGTFGPQLVGVWTPEVAR